MALNQVRNNQELENMLMPALEKAIDYVVQKIWNDNREIVRQVVYEAYSPSIYNRTGEFKEAWDTEIKVVSNKVQGTFKYDPDKMSIGDGGQHSSIYQNDRDVRPYLAEIIYQGLAGDFTNTKKANHAGKKYAKNNPLFAGEAWTRKRNAWKELNNKIGTRKIKQYFEEGMKRSGLQFRGHLTPVKVIKYEEK